MGIFVWKNPFDIFKGFLKDVMIELMKTPVMEKSTYLIQNYINTG